MTLVAHSLLHPDPLTGVVEITKSAMFQELNKDMPIYSKCSLLCSSIIPYWCLLASSAKDPLDLISAELKWLQWST